jgi:NAD-dependent DNA ligase
MSKLAVINERTSCVIEGNYSAQYESLRVGDIVMIMESCVKIPEDLCRAAAYSGSGGIRYEYLSTHRFHRVLTGKKLVYVKPRYVTTLFPNSALVGKTFTITGPLDKTREFYVALIEAYGGSYKPSFTKEVSHVITANPRNNSIKLQNARKFGTTILSELDFWALIKTQTP